MSVTKQGFCLRNNDLDGLKEAETFGQLLQAEWTDAIATNAHNALKRRQDQSIQMLPLTDDLRKLREFQAKEIRKSIDEIKLNPSYVAWRRLAQMTMTRMTIFNKRRGGEVSRLLLETYTKRPGWKDHTNQEVLSSLQPLERELLKRVDLVQIPGKKSRKVPILITGDVKEGISRLNANRDTVGIPATNPFCFASKSSRGYLDNWQAMNVVSQEAGLTNPDLVTSTKLRKYNATVSQLFDLKPGELEWLANHMGHDLNIHKDFYRLHDSTIEMAKVSRLLMAIDSGKASQFVGKQLSEIKLADFGYGDIEEQVEDANSQSLDDDQEQSSSMKRQDEVESTTGVIPEHKKAQKRKRILSYDKSYSNSSDIRPGYPKNAKNFKGKRKPSQVMTSEVDRNSSPLTCSFDSEDEWIPDKHIASSDEDVCSKPTKLSRNSTWSTEEFGVLKKHFRHLIEKGIYPNGTQIQSVISQNGCLSKRTTFHVRAKLQHLMKKKH